MQTSLAGIDSEPEAWEIDFVNQKFNFQSDKKIIKIYRTLSFICESFLVLSFAFVISEIIFLMFKDIYLFYIINIVGILSLISYCFSSKYRFWFRNKFAWGLVKKKEIKKIKISSIKNKNLKIYFKNYYLDCIRYGDFIKYLKKVNCYKILKSPIWCAEFIFKDNPKSGYMLLRYY